MLLLFYVKVLCDYFPVLDYFSLTFTVMVSETQKRTIHGLGSGSNSECNCGNCERELLGKCLTINYVSSFGKMIYTYLKLLCF